MKEGASDQSQPATVRPLVDRTLLRLSSVFASDPARFFLPAQRTPAACAPRLRFASFSSIIDSTEQQLSAATPIASERA